MLTSDDQSVCQCILIISHCQSSIAPTKKWSTRDLMVFALRHGRMRGVNLILCSARFDIVCACFSTSVSGCDIVGIFLVTKAYPRRSFFEQVEANASDPLIGGGGCLTAYHTLA